MGRQILYFGTNSIHGFARILAFACLPALTLFLSSCASQLPPDYAEGKEQETLDTIVLPENPSEEQVREYIHKILECKIGKPCNSLRPFHAEKLKLVGAKNLKILLDAYLETNNIYLYFAILDLAREEDKDLIISNLDKNSNLIDIVLESSWEKDAAGVLTAKLEQDKDSKLIDLRLIQALANLEDPKTYPVLKQYFLKGSNKVLTYRAIARLPGMNLSPEEIEEAWQDACAGDQTWNAYDSFAIGYEAARLGSKPALVHTAEFILKQPEKYKNYSDDVPLKQVLSLCSYDGEEKDFGTWFAENKDKIELKPVLEKEEGLLKNRHAHSKIPTGLDLIVLPENPSDDEIREYIKVVNEWGHGRKGKGTWCTKDPQIKKLKQLGCDRIGLLIDVYAKYKGCDGLYLRWVINDLACDKNKAVIISKFKEVPALSEVIFNKYWEKDVADILINGLDKNYMASYWLEATANLQDSKSYPALKKCLIEGQNKIHTYNVIVKIPGINLTPEEIEGAWENAWASLGKNHYCNFYDVTHMGYEAAKLGSKPALFRTVQILLYYPKENYFLEIKNKMMPLCSYVGDEKDFGAWFEANKWKLDFDKDKGVFALKK
ncbi:MAG: hypothetical protein A2X49_08500 [Lentisphaerae bacterium GWF2_52_8]|nr:MAG: hypothetical protein A2X49_08500 [Lentisphaerae bacterium GWF2_52_8]